MVADQDFAAADPVGLANHAFALHRLDDPGSPVVADLEMTLDKAGRCLALAGDQGNGLVIMFIIICTASVGFTEHRLAGILGDGFDIIRCRLGFQMADHAFDFFIGNERSVYP